MFCVPPGMQKWGSEFFYVPSAREIVPHLQKPWCRPCQGETVKEKFVCNRLTGDNGERPNQTSHHLQRKHAPRLYI